jgi:hypothetical protein
MSNRIGIGIDVFGAGIDADATTIYNRIIADGGVSNLSRLNFFVKGLKSIYGDLTNVPVCYDAHWIGYKLGSGTGTTAGQAAAKLYSLTVAGDAVQATAASQPLLLSHNGSSSDNYYWSPGLSSDYVSTPNASGNQLTSDCALEIISRNATINATTKVFCAKRAGATATTFAYQFVYTSNLLSIVLSNGTTIFSYDSTTTLNSASIGFRFSRNATTGIIKFFESLDGINYTQLGSNITGFTGTIFNLNAITTIGTNAITSNSVKIEKCLFFKDDTFTTVTQNFNPATYNAATSQTQWTSATGEVWTINTGTATTGYKGVLVDRTIVQGDGVNDTMASGALASRQYFTSYASTKVYNVSANPAIYGSDTVSHLFYITSSAHAVFNGATLFSSNNSTSLIMSTVDFNSTNSKLRFNSGSDISGSSGTNTSTNVKIFNYTTQYGNSVLNTLIQRNGIDNDTQKTATYNLIRSLNNNSF